MQGPEQGPVGKIVLHKPADEPVLKELPAGYNLEYARTILLAMMRNGGMYEGTVSDKVKEKRRARNRAARKSRKLNR